MILGQVFLSFGLIFSLITIGVLAYFLLNVAIEAYSDVTWGSYGKWWARPLDTLFIITLVSIALTIVGCLALAFGCGMEYIWG